MTTPVKDGNQTTRPEDTTVVKGMKHSSRSGTTTSSQTTDLNSTGRTRPSENTARTTSMKNTSGQACIIHRPWKTQCLPERIETISLPQPWASRDEPNIDHYIDVYVSLDNNGKYHSVIATLSWGALLQDNVMSNGIIILSKVLN